MEGRSIGSGLKVKGSEVMQGRRPGLTRLRARQAALHSTQGLCKGSGTWKALALERAERGEVGNKQLFTLLTGRVVSIAKLVLGFWTFLGRVWWAGAQGSLQVGPTLASRVSVTHSANTGSQTKAPGILKNVFIYLSLAALHLRCCAWAFSSCGKQGLLSSCGTWASHCSGFSCGEKRGDFLPI